MLFSSGRQIPHIDEFVNKKASAFDGLEVAYRPGMPPRLVMHDASGSATLVQVLKWKTEHLEEYLKSKLRPVK